MFREELEPILAQPKKETKVSIDALKANIKDVSFIRPADHLPDMDADGGRLTICILVLKNGFLVTGESACVALENYSQELGEKYAYEDAIRKVWPLMGYALREQIETAPIKTAELAHELNRAIRLFVDPEDNTPNWANAPQDQIDSTLDGIKFVTENPDATPEQQHEQWSKFKTESGWVYGPVKDEVKKTHPCLVPYNELDAFDRIKDTIYGTAVRVRMAQ